MLFGPLAPAPLFFGCARTNQLLGEGLDRSDGTIQTRVDRLAGDEPLRPVIIVCEEPRFVSRVGFDLGSLGYGELGLDADKRRLDLRRRGVAFLVDAD